MVDIYILQCKNNKYYIGSSDNVDLRIEAHFNNRGSVWTKLHKPVKLIKTYYKCDNFDEDKYTKIYMGKYGIDNVRGGSYSSIKLPSKTIYHLQKELATSNNNCFKCGRNGHFIKDCNKTKIYQNKTDLITKDTIICYRCGRFGHFYTICKEVSVTGKIKNLNSCYRCGRIDHWFITCKKKDDIFGRPLTGKIPGLINNFLQLLKN